MSRSGVYLLIVALIVLGIGTMLQDARADDCMTAHALIGTWSVVDEDNLTAGVGLLAFTADGIVTVVGPTGRAGLGVWAAIGPHTATGSWVIPGEIEPGIAGSAVLRVTLAVDAAGASVTGDYDLTNVTTSGTT